jgi:hypothetical protein
MPSHQSIATPRARHQRGVPLRTPARSHTSGPTATVKSAQRTRANGSDIPQAPNQQHRRNPTQLPQAAAHRDVVVWVVVHGSCCHLTLAAAGRRRAWVHGLLDLGEGA